MYFCSLQRDVPTIISGMTKIKYPDKNQSISKILRIALFNTFLLFVSYTLQAQEVYVSSGEAYHYYDNFDNRINLLMIYNITASTEIKINLPDNSLTVNWYRYSDNQFMSNQQAFSPDDHTGYTAKISGTVNGKAYNREISVWVIDYKLYRPVFNALLPADPQKGGCDQLSLTLDGQIPVMFYQTPSGSKFLINRAYQLSYESLEWDNGWKTVIKKEEAKLSGNTISVTDPPYKDTYFTLRGDQFVNDLGVEADVVQSSYYSAIRVICKIKTEATTRTEKNEGDRPESVTTLSGSAPLEINFSANGNVPVTSYYYWEILSENNPLITRTDESHRYTFTQAGTYLVKLRVENAYCNYTDSVTIKVSETAIYTPNVFTPNGDGINDEFRVAYKSIIEFDCWIFNRWGSKLYHWTDPQKGWDGTINGKPAHEGAYFYVIKALGSDGIKYTLKGDINLLRGKQ